MTDITFAFVPVSPGPVREVFVGAEMFHVHRDMLPLWVEAPPGTLAGYHYDGSSFAPPAGPTSTQLWAAYQAQAQSALAKSDGVAIRCIKAGVSFPSAWQIYVAALRAIIRASTGDPTQPLPTEPAFPAGT